MGGREKENRQGKRNRGRDIYIQRRDRQMEKDGGRAKKREWEGERQKIDREREIETDNQAERKRDREGWTLYLRRRIQSNFVHYTDVIQLGKLGTKLLYYILHVHITYGIYTCVYIKSKF